MVSKYGVDILPDNPSFNHGATTTFAINYTDELDKDELLTIMSKYFFLFISYSCANKYYRNA